jgi:hypothetical protein
MIGKTLGHHGVVEDLGTGGLDIADTAPQATPSHGISQAAGENARRDRGRCFDPLNDMQAIKWNRRDGIIHVLEVAS